MSSEKFSSVPAAERLAAQPKGIPNVWKLLLKSSRFCMAVENFTSTSKLTAPFPWFLCLTAVADVCYRPGRPISTHSLRSPTNTLGVDLGWFPAPGVCILSLEVCGQDSLNTGHLLLSSAGLILPWTLLLNPTVIYTLVIAFVRLTAIGTLPHIADCRTEPISAVHLILFESSLFYPFS